jgi:hypothetical protein
MSIRDKTINAETAESIEQTVSACSARSAVDVVVNDGD